MSYAIDDKIYVVCSRVADTPKPKVPSVQQRCTLCRAPIWVSKKALAAWPKVCLPCLQRVGASGMRRRKSRRQRSRDGRRRIH